MFSRLFGKKVKSDSITVVSSNEMAEQNSSIPTTSKDSITTQLKYAKPKILLFDLDENIETTLKNAGYFIQIGSLGKPYRVEMSGNYQPVYRNHSLPQNYAESEIIIADFSISEILDSPSGAITVPSGEPDFWAKLRYGAVDPRLVTISLLSTDINRVLANGGAFVIFADLSFGQKIKFGIPRYLGEESFNNIYSPLDFFQDIEITGIEGTEINLENKDNILGNLLNNYLKDTTFTCTFRHQYSSRYNSIAHNKFNQSVSGYFQVGRGVVFIFPQIAEKADFLKDLLSNVLPPIFPELFPYSESSNWVFRDEYELREVIELKNEIDGIERETRAKIEAIEKTIEAKREEFSYLRDILTDTGDKLVEAVYKTLEVLGFEKVIDVDKKLAEEGAQSKMEDLQILDNEPMLLIEVKGVSGLLTDDDALAVNKYVTARMRELDTTKIKGLTIVNHQRNLPPLDRENKQPFRDIILTNAEENLIGLLTTWELYKLTRNYLKNNWKHKDIKDLFYKSGRIEILPNNYEYVGRIERFIEELSVIGIKIENASLSTGERIGFETEIEFEEETVHSLQLENEIVETAKIGDLVGTKTNLTKQQIKLGKTKVFRIKP